ncbi:MAG: phosphatase PAP2 family protein [Gaiellaceae bacterium]
MSLAVGIDVSGLTLLPPQYLLVLLAPAIVLGRPRRYLLDFIPFGLLIMLYAQARGLAHILHPHPYYMPQYEAEKFLFAGHFPTADLQHWLWKGSARWYDHAVSLTMKIHFLVPPLLGFALWLKRRSLFYRYGTTMVVLSFAAAFTFWLFPAAPPWAASKTDRIPSVLLFSDAHIAALPSANHAAHLWNPYAAIPSIHAGYSFLAFLFVAMLAWGTRWRWLAVGVAILYPLAEWFAVVYTANHYVVDLLLGSAYAVASLYAVRWFWRRRGWPE